MKCSPILSDPSSVALHGAVFLNEHLSNAHINSVYESDLNATIRVSKIFSVSTWKGYLVTDLRN